MINRMQFHINNNVPSGMFSTKFNIKQNDTVRLSLIDRNNSNTNLNELLKSFHLVMSTIQYLQCKGAVLSIKLSLLIYY